MTKQRPYLASYCVIVRNGMILMQRRFNTGYLDGYWCLPSGYVAEDESALDAACRELAEETGLRVNVEDWKFVCAMHRRTDRTIIDLFFSTETCLGEPWIAEPDKCDGLAFFPIDNLPEPVGPYIAVAISAFVKQASPVRFHQEGWPQQAC